jgi:hypothetical protein
MIGDKGIVLLGQIAPEFFLCPLAQPVITQAMTPKNIVKIHNDGSALNAFNQKEMRCLRRTSDLTGVPIQNLINRALNQAIEAWMAEAELPNKIVKFPAAEQRQMMKMEKRTLTA